MAHRVVTNLPDDLVRRLKQRAARRNRSAEQKHRRILKSALRGTQGRPFAEVLARIPNVGRDEDFRREQTERPR